MGPCVRRDDTECGSNASTRLINTPHIARSLKPERRAVAVVDPPAAERFRILNGLDQHAQVKPRDRVKIVVD